MFHYNGGKELASNNALKKGSKSLLIYSCIDICSSLINKGVDSYDNYQKKWNRGSI